MKSNRPRWILALTLLLVCSGGTFALRAQESPTGQQPERTSNDEARPGRALVHESREAAGEEKDEMEEFKHSSSVQMISRITGLNLQQSYWLSVMLNFAVIAGLIALV